MTLTMDFATATAATAGIGGPAAAYVRSRRRRGRRPTRTRTHGFAPVEPSTCVRILRSPDELAEALDRAAAFEERAADVVNGRLLHYDLLRVTRPSDADAPWFG